jgi:chitinase
LVQGQGPNQRRLKDFCQDTTIDVIPIGFINVFPDQAEAVGGYPTTNYGNACSGYWTSPNGTETMMFTHCDQIASDVAFCQSQGKKILASLGGAIPGGNIFNSKGSAQSFAQFLWGSFGPSQNTEAYPRPFGDSIVDGFDLDMETGLASGYTDLVDELRRLFTQDTSKTYLISCAPQCPIPDRMMHDIIEHSDIDIV